MAYLLDANVFISAKRLHYGLDFCPAFWDWVVRTHRAGNLFSIEKVGDELSAGQDELAQWADGLGDGFFLKPDAATLPAFNTVTTWSQRAPSPPANGRASRRQSFNVGAISIPSCGTAVSAVGTQAGRCATDIETTP